MKFIRGLHNLTKQHGGCVLTIGNFDGVHRGHQALLKQLCEEGRQRNLPVVVMLFEPQPQEFFCRGQVPARLTRLREKIKYLEQAGVDTVVCVRFDGAFSALTADDFIRDILAEKLDVRFLTVGDDFCFGAGREGNFLLLQEAARRYHFDVVNTRTFCHQGERVSSTKVREALAADDFLTAEHLLGRPYAISGRVIHGDALGRTLGFPTANIPLRRTVSPVTGVYAVEVQGISEQSFYGVANIGTRPTVKGMRQQLEVNLLDVNINLYGRHISVVLRHKIRNEQRFASLEQLKAQIAKDVVTAREFFGLKTTA
ncbi:bifunctional riboflavin kinase/FAD synthetase [Tatumella punctata]|uniref:Riboflavin biosynthesis protein n=1 Tax=Tatumella punctata TaxID=399969 RepID=A0ABW1VJA3_9GAMM